MRRIAPRRPMSVASVASGCARPNSRPSRRRDPGECGNSTGSHPIAPGDRSCASPISGSLCGVSHDRRPTSMLLLSAGFHSAWAACNEDADRRSRHFNACINGARIGTPGLARFLAVPRNSRGDAPSDSRGERRPSASAVVGERWAEGMWAWLRERHLQNRTTGLRWHFGVPAAR